jgi:hypothetical protein
VSALFFTGRWFFDRSPFVPPLSFRGSAFWRLSFSRLMAIGLILAVAATHVAATYFYG